MGRMRVVYLWGLGLAACLPSIRFGPDGAGGAGAGGGGAGGAAPCEPACQDPGTFIACTDGTPEKVACGEDERCLGGGGCAPCSCTGNVPACSGDGLPCSGATPVCMAGKCEGVTALAQGLGHTMCAVTTGKRVRCWGKNANGEMGLGVECSDPNDATAQGCSYSRPTEIPGLEGVAEIGVGYDHVCARLEDGSVLCWGQNDDGELGQGSFDPPHSTTPLPVALPGGRKALRLSVGNDLACVVLDDHSVACWGHNSQDQIAVPDVWVVTPTLVPGLTDTLDIATGGFVLCARHSDNSVYCYGDNEWGELGIGMESSQKEAAPILPEGVTALSAGEQQVCVILLSGELMCWGLDYWGTAIGNLDATNMDNPASFVLTPTSVVGLDGIQAEQVSTGWRNTCIVAAGGDVWCWGIDDLGVLGNGDVPASVRSATKISGLKAKEVTNHFRNTCALERSGVVKCWGDNSWGAVGDGTTITRATPKPVAW